MKKQELDDSIKMYDDRKGLRRIVTGDTEQILRLKEIQQQNTHLSAMDDLDESSILKIKQIYKSLSSDQGATVDAVTQLRHKIPLSKERERINDASSILNDIVKQRQHDVELGEGGYKHYNGGSLSNSPWTTEQVRQYTSDVDKEYKQNFQHMSRLNSSHHGPTGKEFHFSSFSRLKLLDEVRTTLLSNHDKIERWKTKSMSSDEIEAQLPKKKLDTMWKIWTEESSACVEELNTFISLALDESLSVNSTEYEPYRGRGYTFDNEIHSTMLQINEHINSIPMQDIPSRYRHEIENIKGDLKVIATRMRDAKTAEESFNFKKTEDRPNR